MSKRDYISKSEINSVVVRLVGKFGHEHLKRIMRGVEWAAYYWEKEDGTTDDFSKFCEDYFVANQEELQKLIKNFEFLLEEVFGRTLELYKSLKNPIILEGPPISKWDRFFARFDPFSAIQRTLFDCKIAFVALLNFPSHSTAELLKRENKLTRQEWIECRLTDCMRHRAPDILERNINNAYLEAEVYIDEYNIYSGNLVGPDGKVLFEDNKKLLSHWGIRDELRGQYFQPGGLERQKALYTVMKKIILQKVPEAVIDNPGIFWEPMSNKIYDPVISEWAMCSSEPQTRYKHLLDIFLAEKASDRYYERNFLERSFMDNCEIPEKKTEEFLIKILTMPIAKDVAKVIKAQLGREFYPFDIWYDKFVRYNSKELDPIVQKKYPTAKSLNDGISDILQVLGFKKSIADLVQANVKVDVCRGSGHAWGTLRRDDKVLLRTRLNKDGLDFQGFDISMHELGHATEMVLNLHLADNTIMAGLPNIGFSEAFAFLFQMRKLEALDFPQDKKDKYYLILEGFWDAFEIAGVALLDIYLWRWLYKHKDAKPEEINVAIRYLAKSIWNKYFSPVLGIKNEYIFAIYSHIIGYGLYMPNYAIGQLVTFQVLDYCQSRHWPTEMERMCRIGTLTPDMWLKEAVGSPLSVKSMLKLTKEALKKIK